VSNHLPVGADFLTSFFTVKFPTLQRVGKYSWY
jgi:hypothetical protein